MIRGAAKNHASVNGRHRKLRLRARCWQRWRPTAAARPLRLPQAPRREGVSRARPPMTLRSAAGCRRSSARRRRNGAPSAASWRSRCAMARTRIRARPSMCPATGAEASPRPSSTRARSCRTTTSTIRTPRSSSWPSSARARPTVAIIKHANPCGVATGASLTAGLSRGAQMRSRQRLRRHHRAQPAHRRRGCGRDHQALHRGRHRARRVGRSQGHLLGQEEPAPADDRRPARSARRGRFHPAPLRAASSCSRATAAPSARPGSQGGDQARADRSRSFADLLFAFRVAKHVKSNAIVYAKGGATVGIGAGQMSRVDSTRIAAQKAKDAAEAAGEPGNSHARLGRGLGCVLPVRRRASGGSGRRRHGRDPARRLAARRRRHQSCGRTAALRDGVHRYAPLPALTSTAHTAPGRTSDCVRRSAPTST